MYKSINNNTVKRYFDIELCDGEKTYNLAVEPPKLKTLKKLSALNKKAKISEIAELIAEITSKNKTRTAITAEIVEDCMDIDDLTAFMTDYTDWIYGKKTADPN